MNLHFVTVGRSMEIEVIKKLKPKRLLLSYFHFRTKGIEWMIDKIGYKPEILLDSGAYSGDISLTAYMRFIKENEEFITYYISCDVIKNPEISKRFYDVMILEGFNPIPVFHYGSDIKYLDYYTKENNKYIALGGTVPIKDKQQVADWTFDILRDYPTIQFHLLGSSSKKITELEGLYSCDSSSWILMAINGYPKEIKGNTPDSRKERMEWQMRSMMGRCEK